MGQEYALEWLDQMVNELDPHRTEPENLDNDQSIAIVDKAAKEEERLIRLFKHFVFQEQKNRQIRKLVNHYLSESLNLMRVASDNLNQVPTKADNFRLALQSVFSCLSGVSAFILLRYKKLVDRDTPLSMVNIEFQKHDLRKLENCDIMKNNPRLSELVIRSFSDIFVDHRAGEITMRRIDYWASVSHAVNHSADLMKMTESFDHLETVMIERNFNSPLFVKYLTSRFSDILKPSCNSSQDTQKLALLQKTFNQIPVMKDMIFDNHFDDLSLTINTWFIEEIHFQSKSSSAAMTRADEQPSKIGKKYERKTSDKIMCNLTVDQLSLFLKAADLSNIISARSLSAVFQSVAPYLSTPHREDISHSSLRVKSYTVEERDKSLLIEIMTRLMEQIKDL
jgi:hypothetical protein